MAYMYLRTTKNFQVNISCLKFVKFYIFKFLSLKVLQESVKFQQKVTYLCINKTLLQ